MFSFNQNSIEEEEVDEEVSDLEEEEEEAEEKTEETDEESDDEELSIPDLQDSIAREEREEFYRDCRRIFINDWLTVEGNWLSSLDNNHLNFLRDILGIRSNSDSNGFSNLPAYIPGEWGK